MNKRPFFCLSFLLLVTFSVLAQTPTTQGNDFWVSYMKNGHRTSDYDRVTLIVSAKEDNTVVTVSNEFTNYTHSFVVNAGEVPIVPMPDASAYNSQPDGIANTGLHVTSTKDISLFIGNEAENSYDASNVLPVTALGTRYLLQTYESKFANSGSHSGDIRASFLIVATEDDTRVVIVPSVPTYGNHAASEPYEVILNQGQVYHVMTREYSNNGNGYGDFSGTTMEANRPISVFNGNCLTAVPGGSSTGYDHVFEQAMPTDYWGKRFVVTSTMSPSYMGLEDDEVKITALNDNTSIMRDGQYLCHLDAGQSCLFTMNLTTEPCSYLESDNPIAVYVYNHSHGNGNPAYGDPSMVWISPVEQTIEEVAFSTFQVQEVSVHYVNIVCFTDNVADLTIDGRLIASSFVPVPGNPELSYTRYNINHGSHTLSCPGGFVAHVYGIGNAEGYAYTVGSSAKILTQQLYVDDILSTDLPDGYTVCQDDSPINFRVEFNYDFDHVAWDFGDGCTDEGEEVSHTYTVADDFQVEAVVYRNLNNTILPFDTLTVTIRVRPLYEENIVDTVCKLSYSFHGIDWPVPYIGDYKVDGNDGCDTIFHLNIAKGATVSGDPLYTTICEGDGLMWFDTLRTEPRTYLVITENSEGCDSICLLILSVVKPPENPERNMVSCDVYYWGDDVICDHTDDYSRSFVITEGCEYDSVLHFTRIDSPPFNEIQGLDNVAVSTNYWPGEYFFCVDDSTGMNTGILKWELLDNPEGPGQWELKPHGASCVVVAYSVGTRTLHVSSGNGPCDKEAFKVIKCSGYAIDENEDMKLEVFPNPARKELMVTGQEIVEVTLYNLLGHKVKVVTVDGADEVKLEVADLSPALYLLEARNKRGNNTRLISVIK